MLSKRLYLLRTAMAFENMVVDVLSSVVNKIEEQFQ
jgi:hypothetical protein